MKQNQRLSKIEGKLSPRQAVISLIKKMHEYPGYAEYLDFLGSLPMTALPSQALMSQVRENAAKEAKARGLKGEAASKHVDLEMRDALFLFKLHEHVNEALLCRLEVWLYKMELLHEKHEIIVHLRAGRFLSTRRRKMPKGSVGDADRHFQKKQENFKKLARELLTELYAFEQAATQISRGFFCGEEVLFCDYALGLKTLTYDVEELVDRFNSGDDKLAGGTIDTLDIDEIRKEAALGATAKKEMIVDFAKGEVAMFVGDKRVASRLFAKWIHPQT